MIHTLYISSRSSLAPSFPISSGTEGCDPLGFDVTSAARNVPFNVSATNVKP